jgi:hypothetical protein
VARPDQLPQPGTTVSLAPVYFPGTPTPMEAVPVTVAAGDERTDVNITLRRIRAVRVRGTVLGPEGRPVPQAFVELSAVGPATALPTALIPPPLTTRTTAAGVFELAQVPPGNYTLLSRGRGPIAPNGGSPVWWAQVSVQVGGVDVALSDVTLQPGATFSGRVTVDSDATTPAPHLFGTRVELRGKSFDTVAGSQRGGGPPDPRFLMPGSVGADGTFTISDVPPDDYDVVLSGLSAGPDWWLRSAILDGRDLLDTHAHVRAGEDLRGVELTVSNRHTSLSGTFIASSGEAMADLFVIAFPADSSLWGPKSRRVQTARPDNAGRFVFANLPAGDYRLCALTDLDGGEWEVPGFLESLVPASVAVTLANGEKKVQNLRVGR